MRKLFTLLLIALLLGVGVVAIIETDPATCYWPMEITPGVQSLGGAAAAVLPRPRPCTC